ncbi:MAG: TRAP transporter substrate-binding protein [Clostridiales Family XIII bacterium]|jgi:TRAP-type C4-dicarboxylate transport system substrate-binding protein|nr:TRAP transporter substrate-binding protein [Clostridiales Family XIII bacterium]
MKTRKFKKIFVVAISVMLIVALASGCGRPAASGTGGTDNGVTGGTSDQIFVVKIGHTDTGDRSTNASILWLAEYLDEKTNGQIKVEAYPDGQLGDDPEMCKGLLLGTDQVYFGLAGVLGGIVGPKLDVVDLPFLYNSYDEWETGMFDNGGLALYNELLEGSGYTCVDLMYNGMMNLCSSKKVYHNSADMAGYKVRVTSSELNVKIFEAIGASPTPMSWGEVYTSVVQGTVDGLTHSLGVFNDFSFWEYAPFITIAEIQSSPYTVVMSTAFLEELDQAGLQEVFLDGLHQACAQQRQNERELELSYIDKFEKEGATVYTLTTDEKNAFYDKCQDIYAAQRDVTGSEVFDKFLKTAGK